MLLIPAGDAKQCHTTIAVIDRHSDGTYVLRALKQKLFVDGLCYLLQEIYGIENKNNESIKVSKLKTFSWGVIMAIGLSYEI